MGIKLNGSDSGSIECNAPSAVSGGDISFTLPTDHGTSGQALKTDGSGGLSWGNVASPAALTLQWDMFQLSADQSSDGISTNWIRANYRDFAALGSSITESSGIFTFPVTGYWLIIARPLFDIEPADECTMWTETTPDFNTMSYAKAAVASDGNGATGSGSERYASGSSFAFVDVEDVAKFRVRFRIDSLHNGSIAKGSISAMPTHTQVIFLRLGDT